MYFIYNGLVVRTKQSQPINDRPIRITRCAKAWTFRMQYRRASRQIFNLLTQKLKANIMLAFGERG